MGIYCLMAFLSTGLLLLLPDDGFLPWIWFFCLHLLDAGVVFLADWLVQPSFSVYGLEILFCLSSCKVWWLSCLVGPGLFGAGLLVWYVGDLLPDAACFEVSSWWYGFLLISGIVFLHCFGWELLVLASLMFSVWFFDVDHFLLFTW